VDDRARTIGLPVAVVALVAILASIPVSPSPPVAALAHVVLYGVAAAALLVAWRGLGWPRARLGAAWAAIMLGALHEAAQALMPWRTGAIRDLVPGVVGVMIVIGADWVRERRVLAALTPPALVAGWIALVTVTRVAPGSPLLAGSMWHHVAAYALLAGLLLLGWEKARWPRPAWSAFGLTVAWAIALQGLHAFVSYRPVSLAVLALSTAAAVVAVVVAVGVRAVLALGAPREPSTVPARVGRPDLEEDA
jgi:VanZ family protein